MLRMARSRVLKLVEALAKPAVVRLRTCAAALVIALGVLAVPVGGGIEAINEGELREWLTYVASDELQGRGLYSTGLGLAAAYIERHLREWGATPAGDGGSSYLQTVPIRGIRATGRSTVTVEVAGERRTFVDGQGITFPKNVGRQRRVVIDRVEFAGYGLDSPRDRHLDFAGLDVAGAAVVWLGERGPRSMNSSPWRGLLTSRERYAVEELRAAAVIGPAPAGARARGGTEGPDETAPAGGRGERIPVADFTTSERLDLPLPPTVTASDAFFELLFSRAPVSYAELKRLAQAGDPLPRFRLEGVALTFELAADYEVVRTRFTHNVAAIVEGSDPQLKASYVAFGAHYDHVGFAEGELTRGNGRRQGTLPGFVRKGAEDDRIWNGADDDGSGVVALMALVKAFVEGPRPKRSLLFVWHSGEERGRYGSLYLAEHPPVPLDSILAQLNVDMIGRNRNDRPEEWNTVYLVGSDRISTQLDAISRAANDALATPLTISDELDDPGDPEQLYFRSDHYSYAAQGIPVIFFTTGLHSDYHMNTDEVSKIDFDKMIRVTELVYETGRRVANLDQPLIRDFKGARAR
jgi:hypothetical protein